MVDRKSNGKTTAYGELTSLDSRRVLYDNRRFPALMQDWQTAAGYKNNAGKDDVAGFLAHLGLHESQLDADDLRSLIAGEKSPGKKLASYLAVRIGQDAHDGSASSIVATPAALRNRAIRWRLSHQRDGLLEIAERFSRSKREAAFLAFAKTLPAITIAQKEQEEELPVAVEDTRVEAADVALEKLLLAAMRARIETMLNQKTGGPGAGHITGADEVGDDELLEYLQAMHRQGQLAEHFADDARIDATELAVWAERQWGDTAAKADAHAAAPKATRWQAGAMLRFLREYNGMTQPELAQTIGWERNKGRVSIADWERGNCNLDASKLGTIIKVFGLGEEETQYFASYVRPELEARWVEKWQKANKWEYLNYPALSPEWLATQDANKRLGLWLQAKRKQKGLTQPELGAIVKLSQPAIGNVEREDNLAVLDPIRLGVFIRALGLTEDEARMVTPARLPALDADCLNTQPVRKRAGLLLCGMMELAGVSRREVRRTIPEMREENFNGTNIVSEKNVPKITAFLLGAVGDDRPSKLAPISNEQRALAQKYINPVSMEILAKQITESNVAIQELSRQRWLQRKTKCGAVVPVTDMPELGDRKGREL